MPYRTVRGAITSKNEKNDILENTKMMLMEIIASNSILINDIISIQFTCTDDLTAVYPAVAARQIGITDAGLFCSQEMNVEGSLRYCIRALVMFETDMKQNEVCHVYLKEARHLRPDLMTRTGFQVAIDGPSGTGKSTIAKRVANELGFIYIDTGAMYRAVGLYALMQGVDPSDGRAVSAFLQEIDLCIVRDAGGSQRIILNGADITDKIREKAVSDAASRVAVHNNVRQRLIPLQRKLAGKGGVIMDGRDIGTSVLVNADLKIYMDANPHIRAKRRCEELLVLNLPHDYDIIMEEIALRDERDKNRELSPLRKADDAIFIDTGDMTIDDVTAYVITLINEKRSN